MDPVRGVCGQRGGVDNKRKIWGMWVWGCCRWTPRWILCGVCVDKEVEWIIKGRKGVCECVDAVGGRPGGSCVGSFRQGKRELELLKLLRLQWKCL